MEAVGVNLDFTISVPKEFTPVMLAETDDKMAYEFNNLEIIGNPVTIDRYPNLLAAKPKKIVQEDGPITIHHYPKPISLAVESDSNRNYSNKGGDRSKRTQYCCAL